ncbi:MAG: hypothetical protein AAF628_28105 [Planctomycetota bacterium]
MPSNPGAGLRGGLAWLAAAALVLLGGVATGGLAVRAVTEVSDGPDFPVGYASRFAAVRQHLAALEADEQPVLGYVCDYEILTTPFKVGVEDRDLRARAQAASLQYFLTQQALAPRILVLPTSPFFDHIDLVVANDDRAEDVSDMTGLGFERVLDAGEGVVLWRRQ